MGFTRAYLILLLFFVAACTSEHSEVEVVLPSQIQKEEFRSPGKDIRIPAVLWDIIEDKKYVEKGQLLERPIEETDSTVENIFSPVKVTLIQTVSDVLRHPAYEISGKIGLILDLANYLEGKAGTFLLKMDPEMELDPEKTKVFFISRAKKRAVKDEVFGSGCNVFMDITSFYFKQIKNHGLKVNIYENRASSLLSGHFIFVNTADLGVRLITQVTFSDSRFPNLDCEAP